MLIRKSERLKSSDFTCLVCKAGISGLGSSIELCPDCLRNRWEECRDRIDALHAGSRRIFGLPQLAPRHPDGIRCNLCFRQCRIGRDETGYCGIRNGSRDSMRYDGRSHARLSFYYDPLPTNCVADWVCAGGTGAGYPTYSHDHCTEVGFYNLAVFFEACNFNCLYCQNWSFKKQAGSRAVWHSIDSLADAVNSKTSCVCFFGGDPAPQIPYALLVSERLRRRYPGQILRICWETNGSTDEVWLKRMAKLSLETGGCIKIDLKAWNPRIHEALCGCDNRRVLENFARLAEWVPLRPEPPLLVASTVMVPGYVDEEEVSRIASFIAGLNPDIPYTLMAFAPQFLMEDFPCTSKAQAEACLNAAGKAGLRRVRLANAMFIH